MTWNGSWPDIADCLQSETAVGVPCAFLWVASPIYAFSLMTSRDDALPKNKLFTMKQVNFSVLFF
jgi:hypothetical protein